MELKFLQDFAAAIKSQFDLPGTASPEDQLKPLVADLIKTSGESYGRPIATRTETSLPEFKVRPDIAVYVGTGRLISGYVELKAPGLGADAPRLRGDHNRKQWEKLKSLPNLIYTDGREWALYRNGERADDQPIVRLHDDPTERGAAAATIDDAKALERLFRDFLDWNPIVPHSPAGLAKYLAPLSRFLRSEVESALAQSDDLEDSAAKLLALEWRKYFFPDADNAKFADAYAQTVTYAMLLARLSGATNLDPTEAARTLDRNNGVLARALELLGQAAARQELSVGFEMLKRSLEALDPVYFLRSNPDLWLYFYEDFLAAYDPKLRKDYGVYYTPREVVELQVRLASELLEHQFGKRLGFADDGVVFLDPAVGTGTYPVAAVKHGLEKVRQRSGAGAVPGRAHQMVQNLHGFEVLVGPYAVAHLRLTQALEGAINAGAIDGAPPEQLNQRLHIYLADTLESPHAAPPGGLSLTYRALTQEHEAARKLKNGGDIIVCLGNPPYDRQTIEEGDHDTQRKGGWVRFGDQIDGAANVEHQGERPIFRDFTDPASRAGAGVHLKNLYNDYVYFWRWALWRLFEKQECGGIITFITASSYLAGPGFVGMREMMRRTFDELWIIDLGGDNLGTRKTPNVFNIQTPVAIAIGVRTGHPKPSEPATVRYAKIDGDTRGEKLATLDAITDFDDIDWRECPSDWHKPFLPAGTGDYSTWPRLIDLFPWTHSGAQYKRSWPIGETEGVLKDRYNQLIATAPEQRRTLFKESRDRKITWTPADEWMPSIYALNADAPRPEISRYAFRSFDRQYGIIDPRFGDYLRGELQNTLGAQCFFTTLMSTALGSGPAITACADLPDLHHFCGRGAKDIVPLYRDAAGTDPNVTARLLETLGAEYGFMPTAEDLAGYVYAVLGGQSYTRRFWNELETPGPRVPLTKNGEIFTKAAQLGRRLIWLHTYAERFQGDGQGDQVPQGMATTRKGVSSNPARYPTTFSYSPITEDITVGDGQFGPVSIDIWEFEVSGLKVVQSWLGYRMKKRAGKKSSPLDEIRPERWTARMSDELLELIWILEATLNMEHNLATTLDQIVAGNCFVDVELPMPSDRERKAPGAAHTDEDELDLLRILDDDIVEGD